MRVLKTIVKFLVKINTVFNQFGYVKRGLEDNLVPFKDLKYSII